MAKRSTEPAQFLSDILTTAVESGVFQACGCHMKNYTWTDDPPTAYVYLVDEDGIRHPINLDTIARGIRRVLSPGFQINPRVREVIRDDNRDNDACYIDVIGAAAIIEAAIFGQIVYA